ncbi:MAG TPA: NAD(P)H-dependent oxidoreductase [Steroidobacteraceae bacterium]|nr:NAD(P)H-dependent oxidoreductase [Steroidobacteraceae bacterium]
MLNLQIIIGSTRSGRNADPVCHWFEPITRSHGAFAVETVDLREWPLPHFQETIETVGDFANPTYSDPLVKRWDDKIKEADAYIIVTPEYNHSVPAVLKNAIDTVFFSYGFRHKPVAFVAYSLGVSAGVRAVEHLNQIMLEAEANPIRTQTLIPFVASAFGADGRPVTPALNVGLTVMLDDLAWMGSALKVARAAGAPPPAALRIRAANAKR